MRFYLFVMDSIKRGVERIMISELPLVSVIVLTYRCFDNLFKTLDSILIQTYQRIEIIISDDGSEDYYSHENEIKVFFNQRKNSNILEVIYKHEASNVGTVKNCNNSIRLSHGKYIKFISPGDEFYDEKILEKCVYYAEKLNSKILIGQTFQKRRDGYENDIVRDSIIYRWQARGGKKATIVPSNIDIKKMQNLTEKELRYLIMTRPVISTVSVFFSKELLDKEGGFNEKYRLIEDMPFWPTAAKNNTKFDFIRDFILQI